MMFVHDLAPRTQFVLLDACGCPVGVQEGSTARDTRDAFYRLAGEDWTRVREWKAQGLRVIHISHGAYSRRYYPAMRSGRHCPHRRAA